jgi:hypothetical protein
MPQTQVKRETSLAKIRLRPGRSKAIEPAARGRAYDAGDATLIPGLSVGQERRVANTPIRRLTACSYLWLTPTENP